MNRHDRRAAEAQAKRAGNEFATVRVGDYLAACRTEVLDLSGVVGLQPCSVVLPAESAVRLP